MKFFYLLLAVGFFFAVKAQDPEEKLQAEEILEHLPELQDPDEALKDIQDGVLEDPGNIPYSDSAQCSNKGHRCYFGTCPRGTTSTGSCSRMYRCCKRNDSRLQNCVGNGGHRGYCFSVTCPRGTVKIGSCSGVSPCCGSKDSGLQTCVGSSGRSGYCFSVTCPRGTVKIGSCSGVSPCCRRA